ncbi:alpha/beta fold hydrolase [Vineibacter terrae]|uniref:Alpha/beta fold hydrolase n=1 Tax=Vineibacter terrae TaxID=2586908 RepID=A0A5C8PDL4_9HYPH|nr:alpha/beta fold hydrolase [Vineibacter terrae]TXL71649.1 alpha/beta fold hydrolase [Vineibacter terrae]
MSHAASDLVPFRPRFPWLTGDLQTIANRFLPRVSDLGAAASERLRLPLDDGSGDTLLAMLDRPRVDQGGPALVLIHGLTGCETSTYMLNTTRHFLALGHPVLRLNLRGAGPSRPLCGDIYYAGRSQDVRAALRLLPADLTARGLVAVGFSLGGNVLLKYLGEEGAAAPLRAAVAVCAPIDLSATCQHMLRPRNWFYHRYIIAMMKREALGPGARLTAAERAAVRSARNVWEYDDRFIAPRHGFAGAEDYYDKSKAVRYMPVIRTPTLLIAAADDPWIPVSIYRRFAWAASKALEPLLAAGGGHVGFHAAGSPTPWHDQAIERFIGGSMP